MSEAKPTTSRWPGWVQAFIEAMPTDRDGIGSAKRVAVSDHLFALWCRLARFANEDGIAWPSITTLAIASRKSRSAIVRALADGEQHNPPLWTRERAEGGSRETTRYRVHRLGASTPLDAPTQLGASTHTTRRTDAHRLGASTPPRTKPLNKAKEPSQKSAATTPLPAVLDTEAFRIAWNEWTTHRKQARKPLTATAARKQLAKLEALGVERAVIAINHSLENSWQGIYEPKAKDGTNANRNADDRRSARAAQEWAEPVSTLPRE